MGASAPIIGRESNWANELVNLVVGTSYDCTAEEAMICSEEFCYAAAESSSAICSKGVPYLCLEVS